MKKYYFIIIAFCLINFANGQVINFQDANFKAKLLAANPNNQIAKNLAGNYFKIDNNNDGEIQQSEAFQTSVLNVPFSQIVNLIGIEYFTKLTTFNCSTNKITSLNISTLTFLVSFNCADNLLTSLNVNNLTSLQTLNCGINFLTNLNVSPLTSLKTLSCDQNQLFNLNTTGLANLEILNCSNNQITNLNLIDSIALKSIACQNNQLTILNVNGLINLQMLSCPFNLLTSLNVTGLTSLTHLGCQNNLLNNLISINVPSLKYLTCDNNQLSSLNLNSSVELKELRCSYNMLLTLNMSNNKLLSWLICDNNQLESLFIKSGSTLTYLAIFGNLNIKYICADELEIPYVQGRINSNVPSLNLTCQVNSYCSFTPGGNFYTVQGNNRFDSNNNGCNNFDIPLPNVKYKITNGTVTGDIISNNSGNYSITMQAGTHTITPILENPNFFNIVPATITVTFPSTESSISQNFCITSILYSDLEITLLPLVQARPGFNAKYKIIYKNKGNTAQSGIVNMVLVNQTLMSFVTATPAVSSQTTGNLLWNFTNLLPFETREILVTVNLNSPLDTPSLNADFVLSFTANISIPTGDLTYDNSQTISQTVVNSFDPNDKTCLEGNNIVPAKVGEYVNYMIRFENTGTFAAQNIVVKDMIDLAKYDIASLIPVKGSHDFYTRINGNKVEFIFENINLPFADATNDGYVAFKIKTKSTLILGNTFSNSASIYFDYNFPIVTNTATTTVSNSLAANDFEFSKYFNIYPNPAKDVLNLETKSGATILSISIYNTLGQLVQVITSPNKTINVSELKTGNYYVKIISDKGVNVSKFIKE